MVFKDTVTPVQPQNEEQCMHSGVVDVRPLSMTSYDVGAVKRWVYRPATHPGWQDVAIKEAELTTLMPTMKETSRRNGVHRDDPTDMKKARIGKTRRRNGKVDCQSNRERRKNMQSSRRKRRGSKGAGARKMMLGNLSYAERAGAEEIPRWSDLHGESKPAAKDAVQEPARKAPCSAERTAQPQGRGAGENAVAISAVVSARRESGSTETLCGRSAASSSRSGSAGCLGKTAGRSRL